MLTATPLVQSSPALGEAARGGRQNPSAAPSSPEYELPRPGFSPLISEAIASVRGRLSGWEADAKGVRDISDIILKTRL